MSLIKKACPDCTNDMNYERSHMMHGGSARYYKCPVCGAKWRGIRGNTNG